MTITAKPRWQFSLRWLIVLMTVACVLFSRIAYFRQRALFHEHEAARNESVISEDNRLLIDDTVPLIRAYEHRYLANRYRRAMYRPLTIIFEPSPSWKESKVVDSWCPISKR
jgi:hypothetical protein